MTLSTFSFPTTTIFGAGAIKELPQRLRNLGLQRPLVVTDPGLLHTGAFTTLEETLGKGGRGSSWFVYSNVHPNPIEQDVIQAADEPLLSSFLKIFGSSVKVVLPSDFLATFAGISTRG